MYLIPGLKTLNPSYPSGIRAHANKFILLACMYNQAQLIWQLIQELYISHLNPMWYLMTSYRHILS